MKQIVSVVNDRAILYFVTDEHGDDVRQIAQIVNPGLEVNDIVSLGVNLSDVLRLNGVIPTVASEPIAVPSAPVRRAGGTAPRSWGLTMPMVLADVVDHPGSTSHEIAERLLDEVSHGSLQAVNNVLFRLRAKGSVRYGERQGVRRGGKRGVLRTVTAS